LISIRSISSIADGSHSRMAGVAAIADTRSSNGSRTRPVRFGVGTRFSRSSSEVASVPSEETSKRAGLNASSGFRNWSSE